MERKKFVYGILVGLIVGVLCFGIYFVTRGTKKLSCSDDSSIQDTTSSTITEQTTTEQSKNTYSYNLSKKKNQQRLSFVEDKTRYSVSVDLDGNAYLSVSAGTSCDSYPNTELCKFSTKYSESGLKLDVDKVLFVQNVLVGNSGTPYCIFVLDNGEIAYYFYGDLGYNGSTSVTKVNGLKDVVSVVSDADSSYVVDINGNEYSLSDYIK